MDDSKGKASADKATAHTKGQQTESADVARATPDTTAERTEEWVFTLNGATGEVVKVERVDETSGQRQELSDDEYGALTGCADPTASYYAALGYEPSAAEYAAAVYDQTGYDASGYDQQAHQVYAAGYYHGLADYAMAHQYETASALGYGAQQSDYQFVYSPEEQAAYYQGMADYEALRG